MTRKLTTPAGRKTRRRKEIKNLGVYIKIREKKNNLVNISCNLVVS